MISELQRAELNALPLHVRKLNGMVTAIYDRPPTRLGIKCSQFALLAAIFNRPAVSPSELMMSLQVDESTASRNVRRAERNPMRSAGHARDEQCNSAVTERSGPPEPVRLN